MDYNRRKKRISTSHTVGWLNGVQNDDRKHLDGFFENLSYYQGYFEGRLIRIMGKLFGDKK